MKRNWYLIAIALFALTACNNGGTSMHSSAGPNIVNVITSEYHFEMPDTLPAGPTLFHLTNDGDQLHHVTLVKLEQGKTLDDFTALPPGPPPAWAIFMGGPNVPLPKGGQDEVAVDLPPGNYAVICIVPDSDGIPHMAKGMVKALTVTPSTQARTMPASDLTLTLTNYAFAFSTPPTAGQHAIRIVNNGTQPHEAVLFRLEEGETGEDIFKWVGDGFQGPPPGTPLGGIGPEAPGKENTLLVNLSAGDYALICFFPDAGDGIPHAAHGMIYNFKIS
jgi:uncharacterized cupredoxin-like copper-binding protein